MRNFTGIECNAIVHKQVKYKDNGESPAMKKVDHTETSVEFIQNVY